MKLLVLILDTKCFRFSKVENCLPLYCSSLNMSWWLFVLAPIARAKNQIMHFSVVAQGLCYSAYYYSGAFILEICWTSKYLLLSWAYFCTYLAMFWYFFLPGPFKIPLNPVSTTEIYLPPRYLSPFSFLPLKMLLSPWSPWFDWWASHPENTSRVLNKYVGND